MVFGKGKQKNAADFGRKGAINKNKKHGCNFEKLWNDPKWVEKKRKQSREVMKKINSAMNAEEFSEHCRNAGKKSRKREKKIIKKIKKNYDILFIPSRVCDRIAIKDNKIIFIEAKPRKQKTLRPKQREFKDICDRLGIEYKVVTD